MTAADSGNDPEHGLGSSFSEVTEMVSAETTAGVPIPVDDSVSVERGVSPEVIEGTGPADANVPRLLQPGPDA
ncbi:hypothetical protein [Nakamurella leprariae]|uniref:Uncharacterized protein n=1 Tax=Nakamurella leprariae TaxID=2803911 RepID=A0A938YBJ1_9ACTN|nr:hypothetical protein [Nakamurella leprariae]MBM9466603.1 hypothetical protein [Nakamurella leprariae]